MIDGRLFLTKIDQEGANDRKSLMEELFPGSNGSVFAEWFSRTLVCQFGEQVKYVHMGFESEYERHLLLSIESGKIVKEQDLSWEEFEKIAEN